MKTSTVTQTITTRPSHVWTAVRDDLRERRAARREHRALVQDLASYTTRSDVDDLLAAFKDQDTTEARQIRGILAENLLRHQGGHHLAS